MSYVGIPLWATGSPRNETQLVQRDQLPPLTTCGYLSGDPKQIRTANNGYNCRFDKNNQLWGFCPTTVINPIDCGLAGACIDDEGCSDGCGQTGNTALTTFTCSSKKVCSTALLTLGSDEYTYIACGAEATTNHFYTSTTLAASPSDDTPKPKPVETKSPVKETSSADASTPSTASQPTSSKTEDSASTGVIISGTILPSSLSTANGGASSVSGGILPVESSASSKENDGGDSAKSSNTTGAIIGGVIGGMALLCIFGLAAIYLLRRGRASKEMQRQRRKQEQVDEIHGQWQDTKKDHRFTGGWGPRELATVETCHTSRTELVELPGSYGTR